MSYEILLTQYNVCCLLPVDGPSEPAGGVSMNELTACNDARAPAALLTAKMRNMLHIFALVIIECNVDAVASGNRATKASKTKQ